MPVIIPEALPATKELQAQNIFVMSSTRATTQDIRPLKLIILNLMPDKIASETQFLTRLGNSIIQVEITLLAIKNHKNKTTAQSHLDSFYRYFEDVRDDYFDGIIVTGAPIEHLEFEQVRYWDEIQEIFEWTKTHVYTSLFICWASQAAFYHFYNIEKSLLPEKLFGVFPHIQLRPQDPLFHGMDDIFYVPHSRFTESNAQKIAHHPDLEILALSEEAGIHLVATKDKRQLFMSGHPEYHHDTLKREYLRDLEQGNQRFPKHYFTDNNPELPITTSWYSDAGLFYQNWLNHAVYQATYYDLTLTKPMICRIYEEVDLEIIV